MPQGQSTDRVGVQESDYGGHIELDLPDVGEQVVLTDEAADDLAGDIVSLLDQHTVESIGEGVDEICGKRVEGGFCAYPSDDCPDHRGALTGAHGEMSGRRHNPKATELTPLDLAPAGPWHYIVHRSIRQHRDGDRPPLHVPARVMK